MAQFTKLVDNFEDNDLSEYSGGGVISSTFAEAGTYSVKMNGDNFGSTSGLDNYPSAGDTFECYLYADSSGSTNAAGLHFGISSASSPSEYRARPNWFGGQFSLAKDGSVLASDSTQPPYDEWIRQVVEWGDSGSITVTWYNESGTQIAQVSANDSTYTSGGIGFSSGNADMYADSIFIDASAPEKSVTATFDAAIKSIDNSLNVTLDTVIQNRQNGVVQLDNTDVQGAEVHAYNITQQVNLGHDQTDANGQYVIDPPSLSDIQSGDKLMISTYYEDGNGDDFGQVKVTVV